MDRRGFLAASAATVVAAIAPGTLHAFEVPSNIVWGAGTLENRFAPLVADWCKKQIEGGILYTRGDEIGFGYTVKLENPTFVIKMGKPLHNWIVGGYANQEDGPQIDVYEHGVHIVSTSIGVSDGYEEYFKSGAIDNPGDFVRAPSLTYDEQKLLKDRLPKEHFGMDMRWLERTIAREKAAA